MLADLAAMNAAFLLAYTFRQEMATVLAKPLFPLGDYVTFLALTNVVGIGAFAWSGLYREENRGDWIDTLFGAGRALLLTCVLLLATTFIAPGETHPLNDATEIRDRFQKVLQAVVDAGACPMEPTTVIDLTGEEPVLVRQGRGDLALLGL
jgi:hypothetical protein